MATVVISHSKFNETIMFDDEWNQFCIITQEDYINNKHSYESCVYIQSRFDSLWIVPGTLIDIPNPE